MIARALCTVGLLALTGCPSFSTFGLARTLNHGEVQGWVAPGGGGAVTINSSSTTNAAVGYPLIEGGVRYGITDHVEFGGRLGLNGVNIDMKLAALRSESMDHGFNLSFAPSVGLNGFGATTSGTGGGGGGFIGALSIALPILFGIDFGGHELIIGPRVLDQVLFGAVSSGSSGGSTTANIFYIGGSIGVAIRANSVLRIIPEIAIGVPVVESAANLNSNTFGALVFQAGVGFLFGTSGQYESPPPPPVAPPPVNQPPPPPPP
jgi:hypothetical protein